KRNEKYYAGKRIMICYNNRKGFTMKCNKVKNRLNAYLDNEVSLQVKERIERHILTCHECQSELHKLKALNNQLNIIFNENLNEQRLCELIDKSRFLPKPKSKAANFAITAVSMCIAVIFGAYISNATFKQVAIENNNSVSLNTELEESYYDYNSLYAFLEEVDE
ncbi:MAG: zf-HC2 domain-containing protein, partial [Candidatus Cloacimonetes bacterium]|nr:zf-HC2 domain-containing protein [Candidatus Cloacimonadota bacterium]